MRKKTTSLLWSTMLVPVRALRCLYFPPVFFLLSFLSLLPLPSQRTDNAAPNAKEQKMESILLPLLPRLLLSGRIIKPFFF